MFKIKFLVIPLVLLAVSCSDKKDDPKVTVPADQDQAPQQQQNPTDPSQTVQFCAPGFHDQVKATRETLATEPVDKQLSACENLRGKAPEKATECNTEDGSRLDFSGDLKRCDEIKTAAEIETPEVDQAKLPIPQEKPEDNTLKIEALKVPSPDELVIGTRVFVPQDNATGVVGTHQRDGRFVVGFADVDAKTKHAENYSPQEVVPAVKEGSLKMCESSIPLVGDDVFVIGENRQLLRVISAFPNGKLLVNPQAEKTGFQKFLRLDGSMIDTNPVTIDAEQVKGIPTTACGDFCPGTEIVRKDGQKIHNHIVVRQAFCDGTLAVDAVTLSFMPHDETIVSKDDYVPVK